MSITRNAQETQKMAAKFAKQILRQKTAGSAVVLALSGDLGAGKTTFLQGFARGLGIDETVNSPTFVIMKKFSIARSPTSRNFRFFYHFDCYRLENPEDILYLGFKEIIADPQNIVAIEWPEKISDLIPKHAVNINFGHLEENKRSIDIGLNL